MKNPSRWTRLWNAIVRWWKNEPPPVVPPVPPAWLEGARGFLREYDELYSERTLINTPVSSRGFRIDPSLYSAQAAEAVWREGHKRSPALESEVRVLALTVERILGHLELNAERNRRLQ
jgi:hypothetical protein